MDLSVQWLNWKTEKCWFGLMWNQVFCVFWWTKHPKYFISGWLGTCLSTRDQMVCLVFRLFNHILHLFSQLLRLSLKKNIILKLNVKIFYLEIIETKHMGCFKILLPSTSCLFSGRYYHLCEQFQSPQTCIFGSFNICRKNVIQLYMPCTGFWWG